MPTTPLGKRAGPQEGVPGQGRRPPVVPQGPTWGLSRAGAPQWGLCEKATESAGAARAGDGRPGHSCCFPSTVRQAGKGAGPLGEGAYSEDQAQWLVLLEAQKAQVESSRQSPRVTGL